MNVTLDRTDRRLAVLVAAAIVGAGLGAWLWFAAP
jgi:hypothetical protein